MRPVFVYGTLSSPQVVQTLLGRAPSGEFRAAHLEDHSRHPVKGFVFPAMIPNAHKRVDGFLIEDLSPKELELFDWFEGDEYQRKIVQIKTKDDGDSVEAFAYIWSPDLMEHIILDQSWSFDKFCAENEEWYLKNTVRPCRQEMEKLGLTA